MADKIVSSWNLWLFLVIALLIGGVLGALLFPKTVTNDVIVEKEVVQIVEVPTVNDSLLEKICENTDGCEYYEAKWREKYRILSALDDHDAFDDFEDELEDLADIDREDLEYEYDMKDYQIRAYSLQDKKDGNWEIKVFVKITYWDEDDSDDKEKIYLLVTSVLDEGDYEDLTIEEVSRNFEF